MDDDDVSSFPCVRRETGLTALALNVSIVTYKVCMG